ncbi:glycosyltransferase [Cryobacterium sp. MDB2-10]|nr:glycosyltransferase [Cryobacterium sp. MDB2-A-1]TFC10083.1 glycosyltransferase [Cryobacterium sp. MDB2-33-2]TFC11944.1 glycosyltransferase [Cryobacterium sp. MDB2-A-2]TFC13468.1 glycosyltransferase [Cryobacterium sp. MDB2-10]
MSMSAERRVSFFVPAAIDDPARVSGGNVYDQHVRDGLRRSGWEVHMVPIPPDDGMLTGLTLSRLPDGALALVDGLIAARESVALGLQATRLRLIVLAHMVTADSRERDAFRAAKRIIATSGWTRSEIITRHSHAAHDVVVAYPGTDPAATTNASPAGDRLLCIGVVAPHKGQDLLIGALAHLTDVDGWTCTFVGSLDGAPGFVDELTRARHRARLTARAPFRGALVGTRLDSAYARTDLVVVPSRYESFGMVVAEAQARGIPVLASRIGGIPEALSNESAGILVAPEDPRALEVALRHWLASPAQRSQLKAAAVAASRRARPWSATVAAIASTLIEVAFRETAVSP